MSSHSMDLTYPKGAGSTAFRACRYLLEVLPVTLAVIAGPFIAIAYQVTHSEYTTAISFSVGQGARGLLCLLMFVPLFVSTGLSLLTHRLVRPLLLLAAYAVVTSHIRPYPYEHIVFAAKMAFIILVFASAFRLAADGRFTERWLATCAWSVVLTMAMCVAVGLVTGRSVDAHTSWYATAGFTGHPATASRLILSALPVFISLVPHSSSAAAGVAILFAPLFFTMRRISLIAGVAATATAFLINVTRQRHRTLWRRTLVLAGILILLAGIGLSTSAGTDLIKRFRDLNPFEGSGAGRYIFWRVSLDHIVNRPVRVQLLGEGLGSIRDLLERRLALPIGGHNDWLDMAHAFGWAGLIGIIWWYFELARLAWRLRTRQDGLFQGACACVIVIGLVSAGSGGFSDPSWALSYAAMGFWAGYTRKEREPRET